MNVINNNLSTNAILVMPHEDLQRSKTKVALLDRLSFVKKVALGLLRMRFSDYERKIDICQQLFNGSNAGKIHRKYEFIDLIRRLGFRGPDQVLYVPGQNPDLKSALGLLEKHHRVLCKPRDGQQGIGIFRCEDASDLLAKLRNVDEPYIVQEYLPPLTDYRYVYHQDPEVTYRFCYKKIRPALYGNGEDPVATLITQTPDLPEHSREKLTRSLSNSLLTDIPKKGERIELVDSGNISKGAYGCLVTGSELEALDTIMLKLIEDLRNRGCLELTTFCFDLGLLRRDMTTKDVTKNDFVFYEYQIPFGLSGYLATEEVRKQSSLVARLFMGSLMRSWIARQKRESATSSSLENAQETDDALP